MVSATERELISSLQSERVFGGLQRTDSLAISVAGQGESAFKEQRSERISLVSLVRNL